MAKKTTGKIVVELEVSADGHALVRDFIAMIKENFKVCRIDNKKVISHDLIHTVEKPKADEKIKALNITKKIVKQCIPEGLNCFMTGDKANMCVYLHISKDKMTKSTHYHKPYIGELIIEDDNFTISSPSPATSFSMADPKFLDNLRDFIEIKYRALVSVAHKQGRIDCE